MFSKTTTSHSNYEKGNPKPSLIKKKARTTILNVLNKRQTQERNVTQSERLSSPIQDQKWQPQFPTRRAEQEPQKPCQRVVNETYQQSAPQQHTGTFQSSRTAEHSTRDNDRSPKRVQAGDRQKSVSSLVRKWSTDNFQSHAPRPKATSFTGTSSGQPLPKSVIVQSSSYPPNNKYEGDESRYSVVIQSSTSYPPPNRRKSSADVTPHDVTVNAIRVYEASTNMVEADPELIARLDKYPSREPPVMSPTSVQRFTWERDVNTGVEQKTRAIVLKGKPLVQASSASSNSDSGTRPRLVSDSVQVSIPFGVPESPTSPRTSDSGSDGWSSSVSVCVPFQVTENQQVKPLSVKGGTIPQSLQPSDGLAIEDLNELFNRSDESVSSSPGYVRTTNPSMASDDSSFSCSHDVSSSPTLVTVRKKPDDELVQKIIHFQDSLCNEVPGDVFDSEDGVGMSKHGKYSLVDNNYNSTVPETKTNSPSLTRNQQPPKSATGSPKIRPRATLVDSKTPHSATKAKTPSLSSSRKDEVEMLRARIKQLESELELEKAKHAPNDAILSSIPILEKEKLRLQAQVNEAIQDLAKAKSQLRTATYTTNRLEAEKDVLETKYRKLEKDFEKLQNQNVELQFERDQLLRDKKNKTNEEDMDLDANLITIQSLSKRNEELTQSESELKERVCVLVQGLRDVKESVAKVKEENILLHEEIVDNGVAMAESMKKCLLGLQQVVSQMNTKSDKRVSSSEDDDEIQRLTEELADNKVCMQALLQRVVELEVGGGAKTDDSAPKNYDGCPNCAKLEEELRELQMDFDEQKEKLEKLEEKFEEVNNDREDLQEETKYLKKVLSYRQDIMKVQVSEKTNRQMQRLETNLEEAEKKCKDLEDEVGVLFKQKQTLLVNIMKLHDEEVAQQDDGDGDDDDLSDDDDDDYSSDDQAPTTPSPSRAKSGSLKKSLYANISNDAEFSSGASFYGSDTESESESDEWSELEGSSRRLQDLVSGLKSDRKRLRSNLKELMNDKRSLNKRIGKSNQDFKSLMKRMEKLDSENSSLREKVKTERRALKSKLKKEEKESDRLRENLKEMESEKAALMKCIEMNSAAANEVEATEPAEELEEDDISRLIAKAQAFAQEEKENKMQDTIQEGSEDEEVESAEEKENEEESGEKEAESEDKSSSSSEEENEEEKEEGEEDTQPVNRRDRAIPSPLYMPAYEKDSKSGSEDEKDDKDKDEEEERERLEMEDVMSPPPPPPHARLLQRRASTVGINMDRVNREKQHLEEEVASLKKYLNRSAFRRRYSTVETPKAPPLGAMKTLESLLQKSDMELKEANAKICRLQSLNADLEERLKDSEINQDDLRRAVVIANNYAAEEREKNTALEEERDSLMQKFETLKRENSRLRKSRAINAAYRKGVRGVKSLSEEEMVDSDGADVESDFSSLSRKSSNASDL